MPSRFYFAFSAFIHPDEAEMLFPGVKFVAKGRAIGAKFVFVQSPHDTSKGHCHLIDSEIDDTWGVIYEMPDELENCLRYPGYDIVDIVATGEDGQTYSCRTLKISTPGWAMKVPVSKIERILEGAAVRRLPQAYVDQLVETYEKAQDAPASGSLPPFTMEENRS